ncbi:MAG: hypothetical protein CMJ62_15735, partial [Planctomycetaceae bacterium]|nr:hypothetical protein [Planctomycetaceae bacterium]
KPLIFPLIVVAVILGIGTWRQGVDTERFTWIEQDTTQLDSFTGRLQGIPLEFGDWVGELKEFNEDQFKRSKCKGCFSTLYENKRTGDAVTVYLVSGTARNTTIHTPDWCYRGAGFEMQSKPNSYKIDSESMSSEFVTTTFIRESAFEQQHLRILWTFTENGTWEGPVRAKIHFAGKVALFKMYLISPILKRDDSVEASPAKKFAVDFMPILTNVLFPPGESEAETATPS